MRHPAADRADVTIVHVTHFNELFWDCGSTPTRVIEHGIVDPGYRYTGELPHAAVAINEARRRGRVTGTDLLPRFARRDAARSVRHRTPARSAASTIRRSTCCTRELPRRRAYLHPMRWTSLGLSLIEAMQLGMPVVALGDDRGGRSGAARLRRDLDRRRAAVRGAARATRASPTRRAPTGSAPARTRSSATACDVSCARGTRFSRR